MRGVCVPLEPIDLKTFLEGLHLTLQILGASNEALLSWWVSPRMSLASSRSVPMFSMLSEVRFQRRRTIFIHTSIGWIAPDEFVSGSFADSKQVGRVNLLTKSTPRPTAQYDAADCGRAAGDIHVHAQQQQLLLWQPRLQTMSMASR